MSLRKTSIEAYKQITASGLLSRRRMEVYEILFHHGPLTAHGVVEFARSFAPSANQTSFNARLSELKRLGVVQEVGYKDDVVSGHKCILWDVNDQLPDASKLLRSGRVSSSDMGYRKALLDIEYEVQRRMLLKSTDDDHLVYATRAAIEKICKQLWEATCTQKQ
jgi:hypothetical protein